MTFMETDAYFPVFRPSLQCWVFSCGLWFRLTRLGCGWSQFCRSWTLASGSFFRKSKRIMVTVTLNTLNVLFHMLGNRYTFHSNKLKIQNTFKNEPQQTSHSHKTHTTYLVFVPVYQTNIYSVLSVFSTGLKLCSSFQSGESCRLRLRERTSSRTSPPCFQRSAHHLISI